MMQDFFVLKRIDTELQKVINPVSFLEVNPLNLHAEQQKVLADQDYDPFFIYPVPNYDFDEVQDALHSIEDHPSALGQVLQEKRNLFIDKCEMLINRGSRSFTTYARKVYGLPDDIVLERAATFLTIESEKEDKTVSDVQTVQAIRGELKHYGFDYDVQLHDMAASAFVGVSKRMISVKKGSDYSRNFVNRLLIHEIGTHVIRAENGRQQPFMIFFHGFPGYLKTEEGLAVVNEERFGLLTNETLKTYAARAIAVKMAMTESFSNIYNYLLDIFPPITAFKIATRAKRGIADTSKPGGCPKDYVYIAGYLDVKRYLEYGNRLDDLYVGKIGIEHTAILEDIPGIVKPKFLPKNQSFKSLEHF